MERKEFNNIKNKEDKEDKESFNLSKENISQIRSTIESLKDEQKLNKLNLENKKRLFVKLIQYSQVLLIFAGVADVAFRSEKVNFLNTMVAGGLNAVVEAIKDPVKYPLLIAALIYAMSTTILITSKYPSDDE